MSQGLFFIDLEQFRKACALSMNAAVSYLVMARGTASDNATTAWSVNAIEKHTGIGRRRAKLAVELLTHKKLIRPKRVGPYPGHELVLTGGVQVCLPNTLIDGAAGEVPPLERLRRVGSVQALMMLIEMYSIQNLASDGGVDWRHVHSVHDRTLITSRGRLNIWGFQPKHGIAPWSSPLRRQFGKNCSAAENQAFWDAYNALRDLGLFETVQHVVESAADDAEILFPLPSTDIGTDLEQDVQVAIWEALDVLLDDQARGFFYEAQSYDHVAIVPDDFPAPELIGVVRLRYRPQSRATAAWIAQSDRVRAWAARFRDLAKISQLGQSLTDATEALRMCNINV